MPAPNNPTPGTPPQTKVSAPNHNSVLYTLDYLRGNKMVSKIFQFPAALGFQEVVDACKKYCGDSNFRFVWVEVTINIMPGFDEREQ